MEVLSATKYVLAAQSHLLELEYVPSLAKARRIRIDLGLTPVEVKQNCYCAVLEVSRMLLVWISFLFGTKIRRSD